CLNKMRECNIIIILYSGEAGWSATDVPTNGICHEEFIVAASEFSGMTFGLDLSDYFTKTKRTAKDGLFQQDVADNFRHMPKVTAVTVEDLKAKVLQQTKKFILEAIQKSVVTQKEVVSAADVYGQTLDWSKLDYNERQTELQSVLKTTFSKLEAFKKVILGFHSIPDNMSVADARNLIGRPFLHEVNEIGVRGKDGGVIHFIAVYGSATENQVKNLVGYPDLTAIKASFGYYLWEKNTHIQMFFLLKCKNPATVKTRLSQVLNWLTASKEQSKIIARSKARYSILTAISNSKKTPGLK
ncbi:MAG TPA: hypothetical protein VEB42_04680, partial [Chitinophagaceae bacterium]|nr:hypothetical protein [Chitinophagaceae bacterium]